MPAAQRCAKAVATEFPLAVGALYVRDHLPADVKGKASMMVDDLKRGVGELLTEATWMDNVTYARAMNKLDTMLAWVAYPDVMADNISVIDAEYDNVSFRAMIYR